MRGLTQGRVALACRRSVELARVFLTWWARELASLVPRPVISLLTGGAAALQLHMQQDGILFRGMGKLPDTFVRFDDDGPLPAELRHRIERAENLAVILPRAKVLCRLVPLPDAALPELASAVPFLVEQQTPFLLHQARYAFRVRNRDSARRTIQVELAVTAEAGVQAVEDWLSKHHVPARSIRMQDDDRAPPFDFSSKDRRRAGGSWLREPWKPILAAAVLVMLIGPAVVAARVRAEADTLAAAAAAQGRRAHRVEATLQAFEQSSSAARQLHQQAARPPAIRILEALSAGLPDRTWLFGLELSGSDLHLRGFSDDVPSVIRHLQALSILDSPELESPILHDPIGHRDRFEIIVHVRPS